MTVKKIMLITSGYPNSWNPSCGIYVKRQVDILEASGDYSFDIFSTMDSRKGVYSLIKYIRLIWRILRYSLSSRDFDMIHAHDVFPAGLVALIPKILCRKKMLITLHGGVVHSLDQRNIFFRSLISFILHKADKLIYVSHYLREEIAKQFDIEEDAPQVINMGVVLSQFRPIPKNEARSRLSLNGDHLSREIVMSVGNLNQIKGGRYLIKAAKILKDRNLLTNIYVVFVGKGPEEQLLKAEALQLGVSDSIYFVGLKPSEEIYLWMSAASILAVPSLNEGFGLVALEAMACGTPVISTNVGGLKEFVKHGESGLLVEKQDANELAEGIISLLNDLPLYRKIVENGLEVARQNSAERQAFKVGKIYQDLVNSGAKN